MKTIVALSTPPLNAAVHIIRISGTEAFNIINQITTTKILKIGYKIQKTKIIDNQQIIDNVLINTFVTPQSYTGEDLVEINCHGGYFLANKIIELLIKHGCVLALPGEFTQRAFMNNKLTLIEAESINNLINTTSTQGILLANNGLHPQVIMKMHEFKNTLFNLLGQIEINIDYPEYDDVPNISNTEFKKQIKSLINTSQKIINDSMMALPIFEGINVTIIGQPNVGKSSLFNAILKESRAIVSSIPGTTRDVVSAKVNIGGVTINLQDTAGLRISKNTIEKLGILKTHESLSKSALIIWVIDGSQKNTKENLWIEKLLFDKNYIKVINKSDLTQKSQAKGIRVSAKNNNIVNLIKALLKRLQTKLDWNQNTIILQSSHAIGSMQNVNEQLKKTLNIMNQRQTIDLTLEFLQTALKNIDHILGNTKEYNFINELFRKFCLGK